MNTSLNEISGVDSPPYRACLITRDRKLARAVSRTLVPKSIQIDHFDSFPDDEDVDLSGYGFVLVDGDENDSGALEAGLGSTADDSTQVILFSQSTEKAHLADLFGQGRLTNLIAKNGGIREEELLITINKLMTGDFFGIRQYLTHGTTVVDKHLREQCDRGPALSELCEFLGESAVSRRFIELARTAADELLMNALGRAGAHAQDESEPQVSDGCPVDFQYACDGRHLAISVADGYGQSDRRPAVQLSRPLPEHGRIPHPAGHLGGGPRSVRRVPVGGPVHCQHRSGP